MIEPEQVNRRQSRPQAINPPGIARLSQLIPAVERISPTLASDAEIVWRHTRNNTRGACFVEIKQFRVRPDIGAVVGHKYRQVAQDLNVARIGIALQAHPLAIKLILEIGV